MRKIYEEMDQLVKDSEVESKKLNLLGAYEDKRIAIRISNGFRVFFFLPIKKIDKFGVANRILEPTKQAQDRLIGIETESFNWAMSNGISINDKNFYWHYEFYIESYDYWKENLYD